MSNNKKVILFVFVIILVYAVWNGRNLLLGPQIAISPVPQNIIGTSSNPLLIKGVAKNVSFLSLDGREIFVDKNGNFSEDMLLLPGYNIIEIYGKDRFGKERKLSLNIYYKEQ